MTRYKASLIHLISSSVVFLLVFCLISQIWYPGVLFGAAAGIELLKLLIVVDVTLGPLITLIIFNPTKKLLKLDIAIVLLCQLSFLAYGLWSIYQSRPVFLVFTGTRFVLVRANEIEQEDLNKTTSEEFNKLPLLGPKLVGAKPPEDISKKNDIAFAGMAGLGIQNLPQYFVPLADVSAQIIAIAKTSQQLKNIELSDKNRLISYERTHPTFPVGFILLYNKQFMLYVVVNAKTGAIIEVI